MQKTFRIITMYDLFFKTAPHSKSTSFWLQNTSWKVNSSTFDQTLFSLKAPSDPEGPPEQLAFQLEACVTLGRVRSPCARAAVWNNGQRAEKEPEKKVLSPVHVGIDPLQEPSLPHLMAWGPLSRWPHMQVKTARPAKLLLCSSTWSFGFAGCIGGQTIASHRGTSADHLPAKFSRGRFVSC